MTVYRVARGDVVRITRTGEVGTVKGWVDHERLDQHGTILAIQVSTEKTVQANGRALEFIADAKPKLSKAKAVWVLVVLLWSLAEAAWIGYYLNADYGLSWWGSTALGIGAGGLFWRSMYLFTIRPHKTRITLPARKTTTARVQGKSRPNVNK